MAEVGIAASTVGMAGFAVKLTQTLYGFGTTAASARAQTDRIAKNVTLYSIVLELLADRLSDDEPIHSDKAVRLADELCDQSYDLFDSIEDLLPKPRQDGDQISFLQKIAWNFKKPKVDLLIGELEYLKSTVNLLVQVLYAGKRIRSSRKRRSRPEERCNDTEIQTQDTRVQNALLEQFNATETLPSLQTAAQEDVEHAHQESLVDNLAANEDDPPQSVLALSVTWSSRSILALYEASGLQLAASPERKRLTIHQNAPFLVSCLLEEWTVLSDRELPDEPRSSASDKRKSGTVGSEVSEDDLNDEPQFSTRETRGPGCAWTVVSDEDSRYTSRPSGNVSGLDTTIPTLSNEDPLAARIFRSDSNDRDCATSHPTHYSPRKTDTEPSHSCGVGLYSCSYPGCLDRFPRRSDRREHERVVHGRGQVPRRHTTATSSDKAHPKPALSNASKDFRKLIGESFFERINSKEDPSPEKRVPCIICASTDILISRSAKLPCSHRWCHKCLKRIFRLSITDPALMPPRCCTLDHIPLRTVEKLFDREFKGTWNRKHQEFTTPNRLYCPRAGCGEWIRPRYISVEGGRRSGRCKRCGVRAWALEGGTP